MIPDGRAPGGLLGGSGNTTPPTSKTMRPPTPLPGERISA